MNSIDFEKILKEKLSAETFEVISRSEKEFGDWIDRLKQGVVELGCKELMSMPKPPSFVDADFSYYICPKCDEAIFYTDDPESHHYCLNCGQAIDWS